MHACVCTCFCIRPMKFVHAIILYLSLYTHLSLSLPSSKQLHGLSAARVLLPRYLNIHMSVRPLLGGGYVGVAECRGRPPSWVAHWVARFRKPVCVGLNFLSWLSFWICVLFILKEGEEILREREGEGERAEVSPGASGWPFHDTQSLSLQRGSLAPSLPFTSPNNLLKCPAVGGVCTTATWAPFGQGYTLMFVPYFFRNIWGYLFFGGGWLKGDY